MNDDIVTYYPVLIPTLNRYEHFKRCVESLQNNTHANETELIIGIDYPPSNKYYEGWKRIIEYSKTINGFKKVTIIKRKKNIGPAKNSESLKRYALKKYDAYIVTDDDNVFSPNFLDYVDKGLTLYKNDKSILAICGYMSPIHFENIERDKTTYVKLQEFHTWGYGRWKDREEELNSIPYKYMEYICRRRTDLVKLHKYQRNLYQLIFWPLFFPRLNGKCDFALSCYCKLNNRFTINPVHSLVRNTGSDGSGVNTPRIMDGRMTQVISDESFFIYKNNLTDLEMKKIMDRVDDWKNHDPMEVPSHLPWRLMTELFYISLMVFGFDITIVIYKLLRKMYRLLLWVFNKSNDY